MSIRESNSVKPRETSPIMEFETDEELQECLKEWQERLFLQDWTIKADISKEEDFISEESLGENQHFQYSKVSYIKILDAKECETDKKDGAEKLCQEKILVHELLHCKYDVILSDEDKVSYEVAMLELHEHSLLEQMAKSLIMAKYNLSFDWFKNF